MYSVGAVVIYKNEGVCKITDTVTKRFRDKNIEYYVLKPIHKENSEIFVPKNNSVLVEKMRQVLSKDEIMKLIKEMPKEGSIWIENSDERKESYRKILERGERTELVKLIKTLYMHKQKQKKSGKKLHIADEKILKDAEHMLYDEFAYVLDIPHNEVVPFISGQLQQ